MNLVERTALADRRAMDKEIARERRATMAEDRRRAARRKRLTRAQKAKALVDWGLAEDMRDARAQLADMGE